MQPSLFQWSDESVTAQEHRQMSRSKPGSTCLWSSVRDLWDELATEALCAVPYTVQSIHPGGGDQRGESTCGVIQFGCSPGYLTYRVIWLGCSLTCLSGWGVFTEVDNVEVGKPDISNSILDAHIIFGGEAFGRHSGLDEVMGVSSPCWDNSAEKKHRELASFHRMCTKGRSCQHTAMFSAYKLRRGLRIKPTLLAH